MSIKRNAYHDSTREETSTTEPAIRWWDPVNLVALFGRYAGDRKTDSPHNATLVGREGQRTFIMDLLHQRAGTGAYLVTGHRGSGKTSFISSCLEDYQKDAFSRFANGRVGRAVLWDRLGLAFLGLLLVIAGVLVFELIGLAVAEIEASSSNDVPRSLGIWIFIAPLLFLGGLPIVYAIRAIETAMSTWLLARSTDEEVSVPARLFERRAVTISCAVLFVGLYLFVLPLGKHGYGMSLFFVGGSFGIALMGILFPIRRSNTSSAGSRLISTGSLARHVLLFVSIATTSAYLWHRHITRQPQWGFSTRHELGSEWFSEASFAGLCLGIAALGLGSLGRAVLEFASRAMGRHIPSIVPRLDRYIFFGRLLTASLLLGLSAISGWLLVERTALGATALGDHLPLPAIIIATIVLVIIVAHSRGRARARNDRALTPNWSLPPCIFLFKGAVGFAVGLQALHPVIAALTNAYAPGYKPSPDLLVGSIVPGNLLASPLNEWTWILSLFLLLLLIYQTENEWIVLPFQGLRRDAAGRPHELPSGTRRMKMRRTAQHQAARTLPWRVMRGWMPVLIISVNLGSEQLPYAEVVRSMLGSLRNRYAERFVAVRSGLSFTIWVLTFAALIVSSKLIGDRLFLRGLDSHEQFQAIARGVACERPQDPDSTPPAIRLSCGSSTRSRAQVTNESEWLQLLYYDVVHGYSTDLDHGQLVLCQVLPCQVRPEATDDGLERARTRTIHVRVYHLLLLSFFALIARLTAWLVPILPYRRNLATIDDTLDRLTSRRTLAPPGMLGRVGEWFNAIVGRTHVKTKEVDIEDARTVEASFVSIVDMLQNNHLPLPWATGNSMSIPAPEVIFVFDELDKVGIRFEPVAGRAITSEQANQEVDAERHRSHALGTLLSEMKNLLSSTPARFFFVGGRNLHDEWLADRTARLPLLTSIFRAEVYLPSLLADLPRSGGGTWLSRINQYLRIQRRRAEMEQLRGKLDLIQPGVLLRKHPEASVTFAPPLRDFTRGSELRIFQDSGGAPLRRSFVVDLDRANNARLVTPVSNRQESSAREGVEREFIQFLAYRSIGNPKRLRELLEGFLRPTARIVEGRRQPAVIPDPRSDVLSIFGMVQDSEHSIDLSEPVRYRLQMLSEAYRALEASFANRYEHRDDKLAVSLFNLADFLFRFHSRGFTWSNLERVDELVHMHRAHDHRQILDELVQQWSDRYLHRILNGMYDFRFRSDIAREIKYISRQSEEEMAAFNFTLDESEPLKALYHANLARMREKTPESFAALGELHEFDQEFELARANYASALKRMDALHKQMVERPDHAPLWAALAGEDQGLRDLRKHITWGVTRLRLILQVGMTYELSHNFERATLEYRNARTLAHALLYAMLGLQGNGSQSTGLDQGTRRHELKHLSIIFQPGFAEAWLAEKMPMGVDTSESLVERELETLRNTLPFVTKDTSIVITGLGPATVGQSNFALIMAELYNKAGDLYFFKGRQSVEYERAHRPSHSQLDAWIRALVTTDDEEMSDAQPPQQDRAAGARRVAENNPARVELRRGTEGYQLRAHEHYAMALHEIRRFIQFRRINSQSKWGIERVKLSVAAREVVPSWETIEPGGWPDYVFRLVGSSLCDISESAFARVSFFTLLATIRFYDPYTEAEDPIEYIDTIDAALWLWFDYGNRGRDDAPSEDVVERLKSTGTIEHVDPYAVPLPSVGGCFTLGHASGWLGYLEPEMKTKFGLLYGEAHDDVQRLLFGLYSNCVAAKMLRRAGYREEAAREFMQVADMASQFLWWANCAQALATEHNNLFNRAGVAGKGWLKLLQGWEKRTKTLIWDHFWNHLIDLALTSLAEAVEWFTRSRASTTPYEGSGPNSHKYRLGSELPVKLAVIACGIGLVGKRSRWVSTVRRTRLVSIVRDLVGPFWDEIELGGDTARDPEDILQGKLHLLLRELYLRHPYPMLTRLYALKISIDASSLSSNSAPSQAEQRMDAEETVMAALHLTKLAERFNAPMHFTPFHVGFTLANTYLYGLNALAYSASRVDLHSLSEVREAAINHLNASEEVVTMRRTFYDSIRRLYYLYDDFNDRHIHFNHAVQMASLEVCLLLKHILKSVSPESISTQAPTRSEI